MKTCRKITASSRQRFEGLERLAVREIIRRDAMNLDISLEEEIICLSEDHWEEMSWNQYAENSLSFNYDEYANGNW